MSTLKRATLEPVARAGEIVTCTAGHELYRLTAPVYPKSPLRAALFAVVDPAYAKEPMASTKIAPCSCGNRWYSAKRGVHFADGWRRP